VVSRRLCASTLACGAVVLAGCGSGAPHATTASPRLPSRTASTVAALAPLPGGGLRVGVLQTGVVRDAGGRPFARLRVSTGGQRGLLGLAVGSDGATYASSTAAGGARRIVVDRIDAGHRRRVWTGPPSATLANGGHLALDRRGRLLIGVGDVQQPSRIRDPRFPNGKLLALDPAGPPSQTPTVLSSGWNNPYAFAVAPDGRVWVADNSPGRRPERIGRGDRPGAPLTPLRGKTAPSGLAVINDRTLAVCGIVSGRLDRYRVRAGGRVAFAGTIARGCAFGVVRLRSGLLAFSTPHGIREVHP
jgi:hypothetical protein